MPFVVFFAHRLSNGRLHGDNPQAAKTIARQNDIHTTLPTTESAPALTGQEGDDGGRYFRAAYFSGGQRGPCQRPLPDRTGPSESLAAGRTYIRATCRTLHCTDTERRDNRRSHPLYKRSHTRSDRNNTGLSDTPIDANLSWISRCYPLRAKAAVGDNSKTDLLHVLKNK